MYVSGATTGMIQTITVPAQAEIRRAPNTAWNVLRGAAAGTLVIGLADQPNVFFSARATGPAT